MPHDPEFLAETRSWLLKAEQNLRAGDVLLKADPALYGDVVFHCQQAAEKSLKAFLTWHGRTFRKTHNIAETGAGCVEIDPSLREIVDKANPLTEYAWKFRYPGEPEEPTREEAEAALATAREVYEAILSRLPEEVRP